MNTVTQLQPRDFQPRAVATSSALAVVCQRYLHRLALRRYSHHTLNAYQCDLEQFVGFLAGRGTVSVQDVSSAQIEAFLDALLRGRMVSPRTAARKLETVRGLLRFAREAGLINDDPTTGVRRPRWTEQRVIAPASGAIIDMIEAIPADDFAGIRDRAIFRLMFDGALRRGALLSLDMYSAKAPPQCCVEPGGVVHYRNKGGATKQVGVDDVTLAWLDQWLIIRHRFEGRDECPALFLSARGQRMSAQALHARIKKWGAAAGMPAISCHLLRHRRLGDIKDRCGLETAFQHSGHSHQATTANIYGGTAPETARERIRRECPVGGGGK